MHCQDARQPFSCWGAFLLLAHSDKSVALVQPISFETHTTRVGIRLALYIRVRSRAHSQLACFPRGAVRPVSLTRGGSARGFGYSRYVVRRRSQLTQSVGSHGANLNNSER